MTLPRTGAGPSGGCSYLLNASFAAADQGFSDAQILDTAAEGVPVGSLTVEATTGTIEIVSNELKLTSVDALQWSDLGLSDYDALTKAIGPALFCSLQRPNLQKSLLSWHDSPLLPTAENLTEYSVRFSSAGSIQVYTDTGWGNATTIAAGLAASTWYQFALVLGGYDSNAVPWYNGAPGAYQYGCAVYIKGGVFTTWTLLWRFPAGVNNVYAQIQHYEAAGVISLFKNLRIPDRDYSPVLQPTSFSTFTAPNGTSLDAITPELGGAWTERVGDLEIQANKCSPKTYSANRVIATVDTGVSDVLADATLNSGVGSVTGGYVVLRYTDSTHFWAIGHSNAAGGLLRLLENNAGFTTRASAAVAWADNTDYDIRAIADGQVIDAFLDGGNKITYGSAALNETVTVHGIRLYEDVPNVDPTLNNFAVYPRTSSIYDPQLEAC